MAIIKKCGKKYKGTNVFLGITVLSVLLGPQIDMPRNHDTSNLEDIIETRAETGTGMSFQGFVDYWTATGNHQKNSVSTENVEQDEQSEKWWEDSTKSKKHHSADVSMPAESILESVPEITETEVRKLVANAPAMPTAPVTVKGGIIPAPRPEIEKESEAGEIPNSDKSGRAFDMPTSGPNWMGRALDGVGAISSEEFQGKFPKSPENTWDPQEDMASARAAIGGSDNPSSCNKKFEDVYTRAQKTGVVSA